MTHLSPRETLELMLHHLGITAIVTEEQRVCGTTLVVRSESVAALIGPEGRILDDLQYLLNRILVSEESEMPRVVLDFNGFRDEQHRRLMEEVEREVEIVRREGGERLLRPMNSFERMLVHNTYKDDPGVRTTSPEGRERIKQISIRRVQS
ncbi:MAG: single-stranded DNA-binding protein [Bdellovibrionaceae bacterium]|nr:single-stranded DNA-binding protein [Pseudobdellovibrionaceae bacterium]